MADACNIIQYSPTVRTQEYGCTSYSGEWAESNCREGYFHAGIDIGSPLSPLPTGTPILAARSGVVAQIGLPYLGPYAVCIQEDDGTFTEYGHCSVAHVSAGRRVEAGDVIAGIGTLGASSGNHLHLERRVDGPYQGPGPSGHFPGVTRDPADHLFLATPITHALPVISSADS